MTRALVLVALLLPLQQALACQGLVVTKAWIREPPPGSEVVAAYMTLHNDRSEPLRIDGWHAAGFGGAMLHETVQHGNASRMVMRGALEIPGKATIELKPGGLHFMLSKPSDPLTRGKETRLQLRCGEHVTTTSLRVQGLEESPP